MEFKSKKKWAWWVILFWLLIWEIGARLLNQEILLVSPFVVFQRLFQLLKDSHNWFLIGASMVRVMSGFLLAMILGVLLAYLAYRWNWFKTLMNPVFYTVKSIPVASFVIFNSLLASGSAMAMLRTIDNAMDSYDYVNQMQDMPEGHINDALQQHDIEFRNVSFAYGEKPILNNVSCYIPERSMTAIVGPSGSGKTTFCNLISRFWDVNSGEIRLGGKSIKDYSLEYLMNNISMVFQDVYLFADTIENNIKFGCPNASRDDVIEAAKKAQCHDFISALPDGYQTMIGEGGTSLSGGEKQRISIARAILKDAPIIIFDEATANVDPENEDKLKAAIEALTQNKTVIMIAHRLKTIRNANRILVLNKAGIEQCGTHDELMLQGGLYRDLIESRSKAESWRFAN